MRRQTQDEVELRNALQMLVMLYVGEPVHQDTWAYSPVGGTAPQEGLFRLLGLDRAGADWQELFGASQPTPAILGRLTAVLEAGGFLQGPGNLTRLLDSTSPDELEAARRDTQTVLEVLGFYISSLLARHGVETTALGLLAQVQPTDIRARLIVVAGCVALHRGGLGGRIDSWRESTRVIEPSARVFHAFTRAYPQYKGLLPAMLRGEVEKLPADVLAAVHDVVKSLPEDVESRLPGLEVSTQTN
jgi:hypothetical protein